MKKNIKKFSAQGTIEFLVVFILLFILFIAICDIALFFRQIYLVQTISDEALANLQAAGYCYDNLDNTAGIFNSILNYYYGFSSNLDYAEIDGIYKFYSGKYSFILYCRNKTTPESVEFIYTYSGLLFLKNHKVTSDFSSNILYF